MKELSIEEKAQRYDEAIERAKELLEIGLKDTRDKRVVLSFFPELAESEDEKVRKGLIAIITDFDSLYLQENYSLSREDTIAWLEKQGEQKPAEWSEEDERNFDVIYGIIYNSCNAEDASRLIEWLKSLRPQSTWKPSEEQMVALNNAILLNEDHYNGAVLSTLREQLKKLR